MGNFPLQKGPCSFSELRTSPWKSSTSPSQLSLSWCPSFFLPTGSTASSLSTSPPLSLSSSTRFGTRAPWGFFPHGPAAHGGARASGPGARQARTEAGARGSGASRAGRANERGSRRPQARSACAGALAQWWRWAAGGASSAGRRAERGLLGRGAGGCWHVGCASARQGASAGARHRAQAAGRAGTGGPEWLEAAAGGAERAPGECGLAARIVLAQVAAAARRKRAQERSTGSRGARAQTAGGSWCRRCEHSSVARAQGGAGADAGTQMEQSRGQGDTVCTGGSAGARTQGAGESATDVGARVEQRVRGGAEWALEHRCAGMTRQGWSKCSRRRRVSARVGLEQR
jgi:hypothetical protein